MSCGVGGRRGWDPQLLWLWCRPAATAPIQPIAWEPPYAAGAALKDKKTPPPKWFWDVNEHHKSIIYPHPSVGGAEADDNAEEWREEGRPSAQEALPMVAKAPSWVGPPAPSWFAASASRVSLGGWDSAASMPWFPYL